MPQRIGKNKWDLECNKRYQIHKNYIFAVHSWYLLFIAHFSVRVSTIVNCLYISHYFVHIIATFILYNGHLAGFYFPGFMLFGIKAKCINFSIRLHLLLSNRKRSLQLSKSSAETGILDILFSRIFSFLNWYDKKYNGLFYVLISYRGWHRTENTDN